MRDGKTKSIFDKLSFNVFKKNCYGKYISYNSSVFIKFSLIKSSLFLITVTSQTAWHVIVV